MYKKVFLVIIIIITMYMLITFTLRCSNLQLKVMDETNLNALISFVVVVLLSPSNDERKSVEKKLGNVVENETTKKSKTTNCLGKC